RLREDLAGTHPWAAQRLDHLVALEQDLRSALAGDTLVHGDVRADNVLLDGERTWLIDWPHATVGPRWLDLLLMLPSIAMQGGGEPREIFDAHPVAQGADPDAVRVALAGLTGSFVLGSLQPPPRGIPNLRAFQAGQAGPAARWLRSML